MKNILAVLCLLLSGSVYTQTNFNAGLSMGGNDIIMEVHFFIIQKILFLDRFIYLMNGIIAQKFILLAMKNFLLEILI